MHKVTDVLINGVWLTQQPTINGQRVRETTYFDDGGFGVVEFINQDTSQDRRITKQKLKLRLTQAERIAIREAAKDNAAVYDFQDLLDSGSHADLDDPLLGVGLHAMEQLGLIEEGRAMEVISAPINENERYEG